MDLGQISMLVRAVARLRAQPGDEQGLIDALAPLIEPQRAIRLPSPTVTAAPAHRVAAEFAVSSDSSLALKGEAVEAAQGLAEAHGAQVKHRDIRPSNLRLVAAPSSLDLLVERADLIAPERPAARADNERRPATTESIGPAAPLESLFAPRRVRGILREMTALTVAGNKIDIAAVLRLIARAEPLTRLPRKKVTALGHSVQLLFDTGPAMLPFAADKQQLAATAARLLGRDRVRIADFIGNPLQGVRAQRQVRWSAMHWPPRGSALVVVGDLGHGGGETELVAIAWMQFLDECRRRRLRSVALIPYESARWPGVGQHFDAALTWDLVTGVQGLRRARRHAARH